MTKNMIKKCILMMLIGMYASEIMCSSGKKRDTSGYSQFLKLKEVVGNDPYSILKREFQNHPIVKAHLEVSYSCNPRCSKEDEENFRNIVKKIADRKMTSFLKEVFCKKTESMSNDIYESKISNFAGICSRRKNAFNKKEKERSSLISNHNNSTQQLMNFSSHNVTPYRHASLHTTHPVARIPSVNTPFPVPAPHNILSLPAPVDPYARFNNVTINNFHIPPQPAYYNQLPQRQPLQALQQPLLITQSYNTYNQTMPLGAVMAYSDQNGRPVNNRMRYVHRFSDQQQQPLLRPPLITQSSYDTYDQTMPLSAVMESFNQSGMSGNDRIRYVQMLSGQLQQPSCLIAQSSNTYNERMPFGVVMPSSDQNGRPVNNGMSYVHRFSDQQQQPSCLIAQPSNTYNQTMPCTVMESFYQSGTPVSNGISYEGLNENDFCPEEIYKTFNILEKNNANAVNRSLAH